MIPSRNIKDITVDELADIWLMIGGVPHLFNEQEMRNWLDNGEVIEGLQFGANEIIQVGVHLYAMGFTGDSRSEWNLTNTHDIIRNI